MWNDSCYYYSISSDALPAEKWGIDLSDLEQIGETIEAERGQVLEKNGQAYYEKSGCPIFQGEEGTLYIEVEPGLFRKAEFRETVVEYYERWSHVGSGQNP